MNRKILLLLFALITGVAAFGAEPVPVGRGVEIRDVLIPGPELRVRKARGLAQPAIVRIMATYPHGTAGYRYDFHCVPMVSGKHDLSTALELTTGEPAKGLPAIFVEATGVLAAGPVQELVPPPPLSLPRVGGYRQMIPYGIGLWALTGVCGFWYLRRRKTPALATAQAAAVPLGEQLKERLQQAIAGSLGADDLARLDRLVLAYCREQLGDLNPTRPEVYQTLRDNPKTALWLRTMEGWLHRPATSRPGPDELRQLLSEIP